MDNLREEDKRTLQLLIQRAKQLDDEQDREADMEDYRSLQAFFNEDEEKNSKQALSKQIFKDGESIIEESLSKEQMQEQNEIIEELQRELSQDELFTPSDQPMTEQQKEQLKKCMLCKIKDSKYTCPGCNKKTCSLQCSKDHKVQFNCNGKPNYTGFVDKFSYSEISAKKDYQYLRQTLEGTEFIRKKLSFVNHNPELLRLKLLKIYARKKHKIELFFAPPIMTRHRENISFYYMKNKLIYWIIEVQIVTFEQSSEVENKTAKQDDKLPQQVDRVAQQGNTDIPEEQANTLSKYTEKNVRKLIDPIAENQFWSHILKSSETNIFDDNLLLKENIDFSAQGICKQLEMNELTIFIKNRYRICDVVETKQKENIKSWSFSIPEDYLNLEIPTEYRERELINKEFQSLYNMIEIHPDSFISNTLHGAKINEFPEILLVNKKYLSQFQEKYKCLIFEQNMCSSNKQCC